MYGPRHLFAASSPSETLRLRVPVLQLSSQLTRPVPPELVLQRPCVLLLFRSIWNNVMTRVEAEVHLFPRLQVISWRYWVFERQKLTSE